MSMVNADSVQLFAMLKKMQDSISSIETTKKSVKMKYEQLGAGWQDKKYNELGVVVRDCNKALNDILVIMLQAEKYVALLAKSLSEYESVQLGSTNGISASTPQTSSFAVTPSSADTTTFESNTFGSNLAFVQDRLSAERYFSREITMKNIEIIGRTGTIPFLEMKIQNSYTLEQGILKEFISVTENLGTRKDFGHGMVERDGREKTF